MRKIYLAQAKEAHEQGANRRVFRKIMEAAVAARAFEQAHTIGIKYESKIDDDLIIGLAIAQVADRRTRRPIGK